jgi:hypothetical protein
MQARPNPSLERKSSVCEVVKGLGHSAVGAGSLLVGEGSLIGGSCFWSGQLEQYTR